MKILYITISNIDINSFGIYEDLIRSLKNNGHDITIVMGNEKKILKNTILKYENNIKFLKVRVGNQFGVNFIIKGINTLLIGNQLKRQIKKYLKNDEYDLILYATPPITFYKTIEYCKKLYKCKAYLMLKDIFPQNAVDIELLKKDGLVYKIFKNKEKKLYNISDYIGCMSKKNIKYLIENNSFINNEKIELFPNSIKPSKLGNNLEIGSYRKKYGINKDKILFVFGGNLGKPQGIDFLINGIKSLEDRNEIQFLIIGSGGEKEKVKVASNDIKNLIFIDKLPIDEYEKLLNECDIGIISLDYRFTIPNYPSRILSYMDKGMPILACTDKNTDIKELVEKEAKCGKWCYSNDIDAFKRCVCYFEDNKDKLKEIGSNGRKYLEENFNVKKSVEILESHFCK